MVDRTGQSAKPATRVEIVEAVGHMFVSVSPTKQELITAALKQDSRSAIMEVLNALPEGQFGQVRDLWDYVPDVPLGN